MLMNVRGKQNVRVLQHSSLSAPSSRPTSVRTLPDKVPVGIRIRYRPFSFAYLRLGAPIVPWPRSTQPTIDLLGVPNKNMIEPLWQTFRVQDGRNLTSKRHPGVGRFDQTCLIVTIDDTGYRLSVDEKGIVRDGDKYYKLPKSDFVTLEHLLNDLWYAQNQSFHEFVERRQLDLTPEQLGN